MQPLIQRIKGSPIRRSLSFVVLLCLILSIIFQLPLAQAQDSGQISGLYELVIQQTIPDTMCLGQKVVSTFEVQASVLVNGIEGRVTVRDMDIRISSQDTNVATADVTLATQGLAPDVPLEGSLLVTAAGIGRTSIILEVIGQNTNRFGAASSFQLRKTFPVRVVPCEYEISVSSVWVPNIYNTSPLMTLHYWGIRLSSAAGGSFSNIGAGSLRNPMQWRTTVNRWRGCSPGHYRGAVNEPTIKASIVDDDLAVSIEYPTFATSLEFFTATCPSLPITDAFCADEPDGVCPTFPVQEQFTPMTLDETFPLDGGTRTVTHTLNHKQGSAVGTTVITITPIRQ